MVTKSEVKKRFIRLSKIFSTISAMKTKDAQINIRVRQMLFLENVVFKPLENLGLEEENAFLTKFKELNTAKLREFILDRELFIKGLREVDSKNEFGDLYSKYEFYAGMDFEYSRLYTSLLSRWVRLCYDERIPCSGCQSGIPRHICEKDFLAQFISLNFDFRIDDFLFKFWVYEHEEFFDELLDLFNEYRELRFTYLSLRSLRVKKPKTK